MNNQIYDVGILTVVEPELKAVQRALKINNFRDRVPHKGLLYWHGKIYSQIHQRDLRVIVSCQALAGESQASTAASYMIAEFDPAMVILVGIAAGRRGQIRIGDVALSREVADVTAGVMEGGERKPRLLVLCSDHLACRHRRNKSAPGFELSHGLGDGASSRPIATNALRSKAAVFARSKGSS